MRSFSLRCRIIFHTRETKRASIVHSDPQSKRILVFDIDMVISAAPKECKNFSGVNNLEPRSKECASLNVLYKIQFRKNPSWVRQPRACDGSRMKPFVFPGGLLVPSNPSKDYNS